jgi:hypothetical protein
MPNPARASFEIELNGSKYTLRPTFESIMEFNDKAGLDIFESLQAFGKSTNTKLIVSAIWAGIRGEEIFQNKGKSDFSEIGKECQSHGFPECLPSAISYLSKAIASDSRLEKLKKLDAEEENPQK